MQNLDVTANITPTSIAAGIGLAGRREICGLLALLEIAGTTEILKGLAAAAQSKLIKAQAADSDRLAQISEALRVTTRSE